MLSAEGLRRNTGVNIGDIMTRDVLCVPPATPVMHAAGLMNSRGVSCLVVSADRHPLGMFTVRDVVRLARIGSPPSPPEISHWMGRPVRSVSPEADIDEAYELLKAHHLRHLVVVDVDKEIVGVVSRTDIINHLEPEYFAEMKDISGVMRRDLVTMEKGASVQAAVQLMAENGISCIIIAEQDRPVGILSEKDVAGLFESGRDLSTIPLSDAMSSPVVTVRQHAPIIDAVRLMHERHCRRLVVVDAQGRLAGLITQSSVIAVMEDHYVKSLKRALQAREQAIQQHLVDARALSSVVRRLHQAVDMAEIYAIAMDGAMHVLHADRAGIYLFDKDGVIRCKAARGLSEDYVRAVEGHAPWPESDTEAEPVYLADMCGQALPDELQAAIRKEGIHTAAFLPLHGEASLFGKLMVYYDREHRFSEDEMQLGRVLAENLATALQRLQEQAALRASRNESQQRADEWQQTFDAVADAVLLVDGEGRIMRANAAAVKMCNSDAPLIGQHCYEVLHHRTEMLPDCAHCVARVEGRPSSQEVYVDYCGAWRVLSAYPVNANENGSYNAVIVTRDISERKEMEIALRESEARYRKLVELAPDAIGIHQHGRWTYMNPAGVRLLGASSDSEIVGQRVLEVVHPDDEHVARDMFRLIEQKERQPFVELRIRTLDGQMRYAEVSGADVSIGEEPATLVIGHDITDRKTAEARLEHMASHDDLTGLPNRTLFFDRLGQALAQARRHKHTVAVVYIDLDGFKCINDSLGHQAGDELLRQVAARLQECVREVDTVARMGGDEFTCILSEVGSVRSAEVVAGKILRALDDVFVLADREVHIGGSLGISVYPDHGKDEDTLISRADAAMYEAKRGGKKQYRLYRQRETCNAD